MLGRWGSGVVTGSVKDGYGTGKYCRRPIGCEQKLANGRGGEQKDGQNWQEDQR